MKNSQEGTKNPPAISSGKRLLQALLLKGHPKINSTSCWIFFAVFFAFNLYMLGPVFVYYFKGVPPKESLEAITGIWRVEGEVGANRNGLIAPRYFVDTSAGPRQVHCGFPMQKRFCGLFSGPRMTPGKTVTVYYDNYFGILAFEHVDQVESNLAESTMSYERGVYFYAQPEDTINKNYHAHQMVFALSFIYLFIAYLCWSKSGTYE